MTPRSSHAVVTLPALDVRRRPSHQAELTSQLLMGEVVRVLGRGPRPEWRRVENLADGYRGWVRTWGLVPVARVRALVWLRKATARVTVPVSSATTRRGGGALVSPLFLNSRVIPLRREAAATRIELPDGRRGWVRRSD